MLDFDFGKAVGTLYIDVLIVVVQITQFTSTEIQLLFVSGMKNKLLMQGSVLFLQKELQSVIQKCEP